MIGAVRLTHRVASTAARHHHEQSALWRAAGCCCKPSGSGSVRRGSPGAGGAASGTVARTYYSSGGSDRERHRNSLHLDMHGTTILTIRKAGKVVMIGDGQVSQGNTMVKGNARKVRRLSDGIIAGFAGSTADAFTLLERLEQKLEENPGQLMRACVDLAKAWRTDKYLRRLEAVLLVADSKHTFELTGNGDVLEPVDGLMGIGSGGDLALAAARALHDVESHSAEDVAWKAMGIAADMCVFTNTNFVMESVDCEAAGLSDIEGEGEGEGAEDKLSSSPAAATATEPEEGEGKGGDGDGDGGEGSKADK